MNYKSYFAIEKKIKQKGFDFNRSELIIQFTEAKKNRLSDLTYFEYAEFLRWLNLTFQTNNPTIHSEAFPTIQPSNNPLYERSNQMRRKIIALFHKMGYKLDGTDKINLKRVNDWCVKYGHKHVELNAYDYSELCLLLTQVEKYYKSFITAL